MPRFFFDITQGQTSHQDDTGIEITSQAVPREAHRFLSDLAKDEMPDEGEMQIRVNVRDNDGHEVYRSELTLRSSWHRDE